MQGIKVFICDLISASKLLKISQRQDGWIFIKTEAKAEYIAIEDNTMIESNQMVYRDFDQVYKVLPTVQAKASDSNLIFLISQFIVIRFRKY